MANAWELLPEIPTEEKAIVGPILEGLSPEKASVFAAAYRSQRRDQTTVLILTILGFVVVAGVQRFYLGQIGMGLLFLFTAGLCLVGTIIDLINHKKLTTEYNSKIAHEIRASMPS